jgi:hypothetical protein
MKTFPLTTAEIPALMETYEGRCEVSAAIDQFRKANGMRSGLNLTNGEAKAEALHWAGRS